MNGNQHPLSDDFLNEDTASPEEAAQLAPIIAGLRQWEAPSADPDRKAQLTHQLIREHQARHQPRRFKLSEWWPWLLLQSQVRIVERQIWLASALVMALGLAVTLALDPAVSGGLPFALLSPIIAATGIAFLYDPENEPVMEIERGTAASLRLIWLARITLVFGFDALLGVAASLLVSTLYPAIGLWSLVMTWLAPMAFLSALAFLISVQRRDPVAGVLVSLLLWSFQVLKQLAPQGISWLVDATPNMLAVEARLWMFALTLLLIGMALWVIGRHDETQSLGFQ